MKLKTQIVLGFIFVFLLTGTLVGISVYFLNKIGTAANGILENNYRAIRQVERLLQNVASLDDVSSKIKAGHEFQNYSNLQSEFEIAKSSFEFNFQDLKSEISTKIEFEQANKIENNFSQFIAGFNDLKAAKNKDSLYVSSFIHLKNELRGRLIGLREIEHNALQRRQDRIKNLYLSARLTILGIGFLVLIFAIIAFVKLPEKILKPLIALTEKIRHVSEGNYDQKLEMDTSSNTLTELTHAFNAMAVRLKEYETSNINEIKAQKSRIESIIRSLNDGLILLDENKNVILCNAVASVLLGVPEARIKGRNAFEIASSNFLMRELVVSIYSEKSNLLHSEKNFVKITTGAKDEYYSKEIIQVFDTSTYDERKFTGFIIILKDITAFKESDEAKNNFIAVLSHELKTPLSAMNMSLMLLKNENIGSLNPEQLNLVNSMKQEIMRLIKMVSELLDISSLDAGVIKIVKEPVDPELIIRQSTSPFQNELRQKNIDLVVYKNFFLLPTINVDKDKLSWVLINMLNYALQYSPAGSQLKLEVKLLNKNIEFAVIDKHNGLSGEEKNMLFQKFFSSSENLKKNGNTDLGLAISKEIINAHKGIIDLETEDGKGTKFYFRVPIY